MNEIKRLQKLAGLLKENEDDDWDFEAGLEWEKPDSMSNMESTLPNLYNRLKKHGYTDIGNTILLDMSLDNLKKLDSFYSPSYSIKYPDQEIIDKFKSFGNFTDEQFKQFYKELYKEFIDKFLHYLFDNPWKEDFEDENYNWTAYVHYFSDVHWYDFHGGDYFSNLNFWNNIKPINKEINIFETKDYRNWIQYLLEGNNGGSISDYIQFLSQF